MKITTPQQHDRFSGSKRFRRLGLWAAAGATAVSISFGISLEAAADNRGGDAHAGPSRTEFTPIAPAEAPRFTPIAPAEAPRFTPIAPAEAPRFTPIAPADAPRFDREAASADSQHADRGAAHRDGSKGKRHSGKRGAR